MMRVWCTVTDTPPHVPAACGCCASSAVAAPRATSAGLSMVPCCGASCCTDAATACVEPSAAALPPRDAGGAAAAPLMAVGPGCSSSCCCTDCGCCDCHGGWPGRGGGWWPSVGGAGSSRCTSSCCVRQPACNLRAPPRWPVHGMTAGALLLPQQGTGSAAIVSGPGLGTARPQVPLLFPAVGDARSGHCKAGGATSSVATSGRADLGPCKQTRLGAGAASTGSRSRRT